MISIFSANLLVRRIKNILTLYFNSEGTISEYKPFDPFYTYGCGKNPVDGYFYFATMGKGGPPANRDHYIFKYDKASNSILQEINIPKSVDITSSYDVHPIPVVNFDANGHIYMTVEKCKNSTGWSDGHVTDVLIYKTSIAGDLSSMVLWQTIVSQSSYPKLFIDGTTYYCQVRGLNDSFSNRDASIKKSTDSGATWTQYIMATLTGTPTVPITRPYTNTIMNFDNSTITLAMNIRNEAEASMESLNYMQSSDGINWSNAGGTFIKNVSSSGALSLAEINANMSIWAVDPSLYQVCFEGGCVRGGVIKILASKSDITGVTTEGNSENIYTELRFYTFKNGAWSYEDVSELLVPNYLHFWAYERTLQYIPSLEEDCIVVLDRTDLNNVKLHSYKSTNDFISYQKKLIFKEAGNYYYGTSSFNSTNTEEQIVILNDIQGSYNDYNSSSNFRILNL